MPEDRYLPPVLYIRDPFVPIYRVHNTKPKDMIRCDCVDIESGKWIRYTLNWDAICSDDAGELARVWLMPDSYQPSVEEMRFFIDVNTDRKGRKR